MRIFKAISLAAAVMFSTSLIAQKMEVFGNYSYMQFNPTITGLQSRALNGGGGGAQFNFGKAFGIKGEFQGYGSTQWTMNVTSPISTSQGTIPVGTYKSNASMFTYLFGPVVGAQKGKMKFFGEVLMGGSNTGMYGDLYNETIVGGKASTTKSQHPYTMAIGGGVDVELNKHVALRLAEMDWMVTRYTNPFTNTNNQNSFRYLGGIVFKFGGL
jgi:hypothetical protein